MKTNVKFLMLATLLGFANFSINAYYGEKYVHGCINGYKYIAAGDNWKNHPYYFGAGVTATTAVTAGIAYLVYKKIKSCRAKARSTTTVNA